MNLNNYFLSSGDKFEFTRQQASQFAKNIAGDFNPIHDQDNKRFCVPGDLLFAVVLQHYGVREQMKYEFAGMVSDQTPLQFIEQEKDTISIRDDKGKSYLTVSCTGEQSRDENLINQLIKSYVGFSGRTFPHVLVPLMERQQLMINPDRPLVIYNSMLLDIKRLDIANPSLELIDSNMEVSGKRGDVCLKFHLVENGSVVGSGEKNMVLSSLRPFDSEKISQLIESYNTRKETVTE